MSYGCFLVECAFAEGAIREAVNDNGGIAWLFGTLAMMWMGQALHLLRVFKDLEDVVNGPTAWSWIKSHPWTIMYSVLAGLVAYGFLLTANQLTTIGAFTAGYMADSVVNAFVAKEQKRIEEKT